MDKSHRNPFSLSPDDYEAIGALAAHYSLMEFCVGVSLWQLLNLPAYEGTLVTGTLSLKQRFDLLIELAQTRDFTAQDVAELKAIAIEFSKAGGVTARRNRFIHAVWGSRTDGAPGAYTFNFNKQGRFRAGEHTDAEYIEAVTRDICAQVKRLGNLMERNGYPPDKGVSFAAPRRPSPGRST